MPKRVVEVPRSSSDLRLDIVSHGRRGPSVSVALSPSRSSRSSARCAGRRRSSSRCRAAPRHRRREAHLAYIGRHGKQPIVTDEGASCSARARRRPGLRLESRPLQRPVPAEARRRREGPPTQAHPQHRAVDARTHAAGSGARGRAQVRARELCAAVSLRDGAAHRPEAPACAPGGQVRARVRARQAAAHRQGDAARAGASSSRRTCASKVSRPMRRRATFGRSRAIGRRIRPPADEVAAGVREPARGGPGAARQAEGIELHACQGEAVARELQQGGSSGSLARRSWRARRDGDARMARGRAGAAEQGEVELSREVEAFVATLPPVRTEKEQIAAGLLAQFEAQRRAARWRTYPMLRSARGGAAQRVRGSRSAWRVRLAVRGPRRCDRPGAGAPARRSARGPRMLKLLFRVGDRLLQPFDHLGVLRIRACERHSVHRAEGVGLVSDSSSRLHRGRARRWRRLRRAAQRPQPSAGSAQGVALHSRTRACQRNAVSASSLAVGMRARKSSST